MPKTSNKNDKTKTSNKNDKTKTSNKNDKPKIKQNKKETVKPIKKINKLFSKYDDFSKISLGRTYKYNLEKSYIKIYYQDERMICQTPMLYIPYKPRVNKFKSSLNSDEQYICDIDFFNEENDKEIGEFRSWIQNLEEAIYKLLKKRQYLKIKKTGHHNIIKYDDYRDCSKITLKLHLQKSKLFRLGGIGKIEDNVKIKEVEGQCYGLFILEFQSIWIKKPIEGIDEDDTVQWGIYFTVHGGQLLPNPSRLQPLSNLENEFISNPKMINKLKDLNNIPLPPPPPPLPSSALILSNGILEQKKKVINKYLKMKSMGVPLPAIYQKMAMDGLQKDWLLKPDLIPMDFINSREEEINIGSVIDNIENTLRITTDMLSSVSLRKRTHEEIERDRIAKEKKRKEMLKKKALGGMAPKGFAVELDDILNMKSRLKSIDKNKKK